jgi:hypothetical protein
MDRSSVTDSISQQHFSSVMALSIELDTTFGAYLLGTMVSMWLVYISDQIYTLPNSDKASTAYHLLSVSTII